MGWQTPRLQQRKTENRISATLFMDTDLINDVDGCSMFYRLYNIFLFVNKSTLSYKVKSKIYTFKKKFVKKCDRYFYSGKKPYCSARLSYQRYFTRIAVFFS